MMSVVFSLALHMLVPWAVQFGNIKVGASLTTDRVNPT